MEAIVLFSPRITMALPPSILRVKEERIFPHAYDESIRLPRAARHFLPMGSYVLLRCARLQLEVRRDAGAVPQLVTAAIFAAVGVPVRRD